MNLKNLITVIGAHAEGEVGRVITGGVIAPRAASMFERQQLLQEKQDWLRTLLLSDPRGSVNAAVNLVTPPISSEADFGMIVIEADSYPPMSGSNLMCTVTVVLESGMLPMTSPITELCVDTPAGLVRVRAELPVPQGLRSSRPGDTTTAFLAVLMPSTTASGPANWAMSMV